MITFRQFLEEGRPPRTPERAEKLYNRVLQKKRYDPEGQIPNFLPYGEHPLYPEDGSHGGYSYDLKRHFEKEMKKAPIVDVPVKSITSHQYSIGAPNLLDKIHGRGENIPEIPEFYVPHGEPNRYHLDDGNHRSNGALFKREGTIKGRVIHLPPPPNPKGRIR